MLCAAVYLDGKRLQMAVGENEQEHILGLESGELMLLWQLHRPDIGSAVEISTGAPPLATLTKGASSTLLLQCKCLPPLHKRCLEL